MIINEEFVHRLRRIFDERITELSEPLIRGEAMSYEQYKQQVGCIMGIRLCRVDMDNLFRQAAGK